MEFQKVDKYLGNPKNLLYISKNPATNSNFFYSIASFGKTFIAKNVEIQRQSNECPYFSLIYVESGKLVGKVGSAPFVCESNQLFFVDSNKKHSYMSACSTEIYFINFNGYNCKDFYSEYSKNKDIVLDIPNFNNHITKIKNLASDIDNNAYIGISLISQLVYGFLCDIIDDSDIQSKTHSVLVEQMIEYLNQNYNTKIKLNALCKSLYVSNQYAIKIFKKEVGKTPYQYFLDIKLKEAIRLLVETNLSIEEIAEKVSFSSCYNFIKVFKEKYLSTPAVYRKNIIAKSAGISSLEDTKNKKF